MKYINYPSNSGHTKRMSLIVPQTRERKKKKKKIHKLVPEDSY